MNPRKLIQSLENIYDVFKDRLPPLEPINLKEQEQNKKKNQDTPDVKYLVNLDAQRTLTEFARLIVALNAIKEESLTAEHVKVVQDFLKNREVTRVADTPADYPMMPQSFANDMCLRIAKTTYDHATLAKIDCPFHLEMCMPSIAQQAWTNTAENNGDLRKASLHQIQRTSRNVSRDGKPSTPGNGLIEVYSVISSHNHRNPNDLRTKDSFTGKSRALTVDESRRVYDHSELSSEYFNKGSKLGNHARKKKLLSALKSPNYGGHAVTASYGDAGYELLKQNLVDLGLALFANREQVFDHMNCKINRQDWKDFLNGMIGKDPAAFIKFMTPEGGAKSTVMNHDLYTGDLRHDAAVLFCLATSHAKWRAEQGDKTSLTSWLVGVGHNKEQKMKALDFLFEYLVSDDAKHCLDGWKEHLEKNFENSLTATQGNIDRLTGLLKTADEQTGELYAQELTDAKKQLKSIQGEKAMLSSALKGGTLGYITSQFKAIDAMHEQHLADIEKQQEVVNGM